MKNVFVTSDLHIGHLRAIEFDKRPFRDLEHMHTKIVENYNATVPTDGVCYFLGDVGVGDKAALREVIAAMNGTKILVVGNHDAGVESMIKLGFHTAIYGAVVYLHGERVTMSHCPLAGVYREPTDHFHNPEKRGGNWHGEGKSQRFTFTNEGQFHLHGHIHAGKHTPDKKVYLGRQMDVGCVAHHFRPVSFSHVESWIMKTLAEEKAAL